MTRPQVGVRARRQEETRARILADAARLFADQGYAGTSMDQVAEAAGVAKGTIFYNFASKAALFEALVERAVEAFTDDLAGAREEARGWDALVRAGEAVARRVDEHPHIAQILLVELVRTGRPWAATIERARAVMLAPLMAMVRELAQDRYDAGVGAPDPGDAVVETAAIALLGALAVATLDRAAHQGERPLADVLGGLTLALSGLRPGGPPAPGTPTGCPPSGGPQ